MRERSEPPLTIRRLDVGEHALLRALRLRALERSPGAFGDRLEEEREREETWWVRLAASVSEPGPHAAFIAELDGAPVGMAYGLIDAERADGVRVGGMWVDAGARRRGVGAALLTSALRWGEAQGRAHAGLWAPAHAAGALQLYQRFGFQPTGESRVLRPELTILAFVRPG